MNLFLGDLIDKNISMRVLSSICVVGLAIISLDFIFTILSELSDLSENYGLTDALLYSIFSLPYSAYDFLSYICLIGVLVALGSLSEEGEITAARVLGKSDINIIWASIKPVILVLIVGALSSQFFIPGLSQNSEETRLLKQNRISLEDGYWLASDSSVSYFKSAPNSNSIQDVIIYRLNDSHQLKEITTAEEANKIGNSWSLLNLEIFDVDSGAKKSLREMEWAEGPQKEDFNLILSPKYFSLTNLYKNVNEEQSKYRQNVLLLEFWRKALQPIFSILLAILAASFIFGPARDQKIGQRVLTGIILAFSLSISQRLFESMALVSFLSPLVSVMIPIFIVLGLTVLAWKVKSF
jgi:lipopolysaccharide export system permease protein